MPACVWKNVYDRATHCWVMRCIDGVSPNRKHDVCYDAVRGGGAVMAPNDLPVIVAAPGAGIFSPPLGGWVQGLSDSYGALDGGFPAALPPGGFFSPYGSTAPVYVRDAHDGQWYEDAAPNFTPMPPPGASVAVPEMPAGPVPLPTPADVPSTPPGTPGVPGVVVLEPPPPTSVPEPSALALLTGWLFLFAFALWLHRNWPGASNEKE